MAHIYDFVFDMGKGWELTGGAPEHGHMSERTGLHVQIKWIFRNQSVYPRLGDLQINPRAFLHEFCRILIEEFNCSKNDFTEIEVFEYILRCRQEYEAQSVVRAQLAKIQKCEVCDTQAFLKLSHELLLCQKCLEAVNSPIKKKWWQRNAKA